jgi:hypothetical protein
MLGITGSGEQFCHVLTMYPLIVVNVHSAKFEKDELFSILAHSVLAKQDGARGCHFHKHSNNGEGGQESNKSE